MSCKQYQRNITAKCFKDLRFRKFSRSEEHTSELQSQSNLVCRLLLEKKKKCCPPAVSFHLVFHAFMSALSSVVAQSLDCSVFTRAVTPASPCPPAFGCATECIPVGCQ